MSNFEKLLVKVTLNPYDFTTWTGLLELSDKHEDANKYREIFDQFLDLFPYCYGYWKKYAELEKHKHSREEALKVYKRGIEAIPLSVDLWIAYIETFAEANQTQPDFEEKMRQIYEQAVDMAGLEFRSDPLWENYISWETGSNRLIEARNLYERLLAIPTQLYFQNWDSFKRLIEENSLKDLFSAEEIAPYHAKVDAKAAKAIEAGLYLGLLLPGDDEPDADTNQPRCYFISFEEEETLKQMIVNSREKIYQATYQQIMKRWYFEDKIRRPYFHVKPLDDVQVVNWGEYLSFEIAELQRLNQLSDSQKEQLYGSHAGPKRVRVLFERCVIACAMYEHIWIRYAKYLESEEKDLESAFRVFFRAANIHLRNKATIHLHWALFLDRHPELLARKDLIPMEGAQDTVGWPLMPLQKEANLGLDAKQNVCPGKSLDILTALEKRLPNSALVCSRRCDFMRRSGASLTELVMVLRSGINRLRYAATEQYKRAYEVRGTSASISAQKFLHLSQQTKAGAAFLACKLARLIQHLVPPTEGIPKWKLLLDTAYKPCSQPPQVEEEEEEEEPESKRMKVEENGLAEEVKIEVTVLQLPDVRTLSEADRESMSGYEAAIAVLEEAFEYEPRNERVLVQLLDFVYQNRPVNLKRFVDICDRAILSSLLPESSKLAFMQRKLQFLEEFADDSATISAAYESYLNLANSLNNSRVKKEEEHERYPTHHSQDMLNLTPAAALLGGKMPVAMHSQTTVATFAPISKAQANTAVSTLMAGSESFHGSLGEVTAHSQYSAGAYDPMALAQGNTSGLPPPAPVVPLMHPPMGDTSSMGAQNEAWRKAAAAVGQQMAQPRVIEHI